MIDGLKLQVVTFAEGKSYFTYYIGINSDDFFHLFDLSKFGI